MLSICPLVLSPLGQLSHSMRRNIEGPDRGPTVSLLCLLSSRDKTRRTSGQGFPFWQTGAQARSNGISPVKHNDSKSRCHATEVGQCQRGHTATAQGNVYNLPASAPPKHNLLTANAREPRQQRYPSPSGLLDRASTAASMVSRLTHRRHGSVD